MLIKIHSLLLRNNLIKNAYTARVHTLLGRYDHSKLWYLLRSFDITGSGVSELPMSLICSVLSISNASIYRWLRTGKKADFFRSYSVRKGILTTYLGGLRPVCWKLELATWGATADVPLLSVVNNLRATVTQIETQALQQSSHYAALRTISPESRKQLHRVDPNFLIQNTGATNSQDSFALETNFQDALGANFQDSLKTNFQAITPRSHCEEEITSHFNHSTASQVPTFGRVSTGINAINQLEPLDKEGNQCNNHPVLTQPKPVLRHELGVQSSPKSIVGQVPFVLHVSQTRLFVSRNFLCFGATQNSISRTLGISVKTTQRHQKVIGLSHLQLCQEKNEYKDIRQTLRMEFHSHDVYDQNNRTRVGFKDCGDSYRFEDGMVIGSKTSEPNTYPVKKDGFLNRFFKLGTQYFLAKCNIYREDLQLTTMRFAKKLWKQERKKRLQQVSL